MEMIDKLISDCECELVDTFKILDGICYENSKKVLDAFHEVEISENDFNYQAFELFLKYDVITPQSLEKLIESGKVESFENCVELINKYKES